MGWFKEIFQKKTETEDQLFPENKKTEAPSLTTSRDFSTEKETIPENSGLSPDISLISKEQTEIVQAELAKNSAETVDTERDKDPPDIPELIPEASLEISTEKFKEVRENTEKTENKIESKVKKMSTENTNNDNNTIKQRLEVLLFMSREPLSEADLIKFIGCSSEILKSELLQLQEEYNQPSHGIQIIQIADKYQFATKSEYTKTVEDYINAPTEVSLSTAALETLSIIAYRQPITRTEVEAIRGVNSDGIIKSLLDKEFIEECGKADTIGRPTLYGTTDLFLRHFGLKDLADLPAEPKALMNSQEAEEALRIFRHSLVANAELELAAEDNVASPANAG